MEVLDSDDADKRAEKLDMLLDLCKGADFWIIPALKSQVEDRILAAGKKFINLENVVDVQERADEVGAKAVREMCAHSFGKTKMRWTKLILQMKSKVLTALLYYTVFYETVNKPQFSGVWPALF
jgi:hypothetical protein